MIYRFLMTNKLRKAKAPPDEGVILVDATSADHAWGMFYRKMGNDVDDRYYIKLLDVKVGEHTKKVKVER